MSKPIQVFKAGRRTARSGEVIDFTEAMLRATARAYNPAKHHAPLVLGHPSTDGPAYGWAQALYTNDGALEAVPEKIDAAFAEWVNTGRANKISASFYPPDHPGNPVPGVYYLRHVGFLGAEPPSIKGLRPPEFADDAAGTLEFADYDGLTIVSLFRRLKNYFIERDGADKADNVLPEYELSSLQINAAQDTESDSPSAPIPAFSETTNTGVTMTPEQIAARDAELKAKAEAQAAKDAEQAARDAQFAERETRLAAAEAASARAEVVEFVEGLVKAGQVLPVFKDGLIALMAGMAPAQVVEFGEGDAKVSKPGAAWLREYLAAQPKQVEFSEKARSGSTVLADNGNAEDLANRATEFQEAEKKAGREISISMAVKHVTQQAA